MNAATHAAGLVLFVVLGIWLAVKSGEQQATSLTLAVCVFIGALWVMYGASVAYHCSADPARKAVLRVLDHCAIYLLIAGTYTPFALALDGDWGDLLLAIVWPLAAIGIAIKVLLPMRGRWMSTASFVALGWIGVVAGAEVMEQFPADTLAWLLAGGVAYTAGTPFYMFSRVRYMHALWHGLVMVGTVCHFAAVASLVLR